MVVVSIGKPELGKKLLKHLEVDNGEEWIFVDPDNRLYDALQLNSGIETTFLSIETPFAFRDRFFGSNGRKDGMKDLLDVLGKWKDAIYIPPKQERKFYCISYEEWIHPQNQYSITITDNTSFFALFDLFIDEWPTEAFQRKFLHLHVRQSHGVLFQIMSNICSMCLQRVEPSCFKEQIQHLHIMMPQQALI